jgi:hypothetical protein
MLSIRLHLEQVSHIDEADLQIREFGSQQRGSGEWSLGCDSACAGHYQIWFLPLIVAYLAQDADPFPQCVIAASISRH